MNWLITTLASLGGCGFIGTTIVALLNRRKIRAEAAKTGADAAAILTETALRAATKSIEEVERRADSLSAELARASVQVAALLEHVEVLQDLLQAAGVRPPAFRPPYLKVAKEGN